MTTPTEITCKELVEIVTGYLDGKLSPEDTARFEYHLTECDGCTTYVEQIRQTVRLTGHLSEEKISEPARRKLLDEFRAWKQGS